MRWAEAYWHGVPVMRRRIEEIARRTRKGRVLDLGCNDGQLSQCIWEQGEREVVGVDVSTEMLVRAKEWFGSDGPAWVKADGNTLPFPDDHFDTVVMAELMEHLGKDMGKVLAEAHRVSKGHLIWSMPVGEYWLGEPSHQWALSGKAISHNTVEGVDDCKELELSNHIVVVEWDRRRQLTVP